MVQAQKGASAEPAWEIIDDADSRVVYSEGFRTNGANSKRFNSTGHNYNLPGATIDLTFTGIGIEIFGGMQHEHGKAEIFIDGQSVGIIDTYQQDEVLSTKTVSYTHLDVYKRQSRSTYSWLHRPTWAR